MVLRSFYTFVVQTLPALDAVVLAICWALVSKSGQTLAAVEVLCTALIVPACTWTYRYFGVYESHRIGGLTSLLRSLITAHALLVFAALSIVTAFGATEWITTLGRFAVLSAVSLLIPRGLFYMLAQSVRRRGFDARNVCVMGSWEDARGVAARFASQPEWGLAVTYVGTGDPSARCFYAYPSGRKVAEDVKQLLHDNVVDEVVAVSTAENVSRELELLRIASMHGTVCRVLMKRDLDDAQPTRLEEYCGGLALNIADHRRRGCEVFVKRAIDTIGSACALIVLAPLLVAIAAFVKLSSPGPVIFRQTRIGLNGRKFTMLKFRTMVRDAEDLLPTVATHQTMNGPIFKDPSDCRITPLGRILRRFSFDELPQFVNVLLGDMSLVGPRPLPVYEAQVIEGIFRKRFSVKPGLTGLWQISGRSQVSFASWMSYDLQYVNGWSLWLDLKVLLKTVPAVIAGRGAY
jgi:exopolysaccharide biosynthesis polyprenyl glycosylphosphotransferase